jgi:hypothetical protein
MEPPALHVSEAVERLKGVFLEIPGTRLSVGDASRLAGLDDLLCQEGRAAPFCWIGGELPARKRLKPHR